MSLEASALILAWLAILLLALAMSGLLRQLRALSIVVRNPVQVETRALGKQIPPLANGAVEWDKTAVLLFAAADCQACATRVTELDEAAVEAGDALTFLVLVADEADGLKAHNVRILENERDVFDRLGISITPHGVVVSREGTVVHSAPLGSSSLLRDLVKKAEEVR